MQRRQFITAGLLGSVALIGAGNWWLRGASDRSRLDFQALRRSLQSLKLSTLQTTGQWDLARIFYHCAQSIDFSMHGYPQHKPEWFKASVGPSAFAVFAERGRMQHDLDEAIPGAPGLPEDGDVSAAHATLLRSMSAFDQHTGPLAPHFAFGSLSRREYEIAHVMHIENHFLEIAVL